MNGAELSKVMSAVEQRLDSAGIEILSSGEVEGYEGLGVWDVELRRSAAAWRRTMVAASLPALSLGSYAEVPWPHDIERPRLLLGPRVTPRSAGQFRRLDVNFVDTVGNVFIRDPDLLIDIRRSGTPVRDEPASDSVNVFSTKRSQVVFALLSWPSLVGAPIRRVAVTSGVSVGLAKEVIDHLESSTGGLRALWPGGRARDQLVEQWVAAFPSGLGSERQARKFEAEDFELQAIDGVQIAVSGERAAGWLRNAETLSLWVRPWDPKIPVRHHWRSGGTPNVIIRKAFWEAPISTGDPIRPAPPLLVYAELSATTDSRLHEAAREVRMATELVDE